MRRFALVILALLLALAASVPAAPLDRQVILDSARRYTYMWWTDALDDPDRAVGILTDQYAMRLDVRTLQATDLSPMENPLTEQAALQLRNNVPLDDDNGELRCTLGIGNHSYGTVGASSRLEDSQLIESGKFFQRRLFNHLQWSGGCPKLESSLELSAWPDRLILVLRITPEQDVNMDWLYLDEVTPLAFMFQGKAYPKPAAIDRDGTGFICRAKLRATHWKAGQEQTLAMVLMHGPGSASENLKIEAHDLAPGHAALTCTEDPILGWYRIELPDGGRGNLSPEEFNQHLDRIAFSVENTTDKPQVARLCFARGLPGPNRNFELTGISAILCDADGYPTGIPIQLSKNWHTKIPGRYVGPWYRGITMLTVPPKTKLNLQYVLVNALWGGVPAASHAQLCLVGWGSNQLWEEAALGAWGESLCFEPDQGQKGGSVLDTRPLMVTGMNGGKWSWTNNVGGADFLVYYDAQGKKQPPVRMKALHTRTGPVLTETTYAGSTADAKVDLEYTASLYRTDDITRGIYHLRYDVRHPVDFQRLVLFQCGGDDYSYTGERKMAWGNEDGVKKEWDTHWGGNIYRTDPFEATGRIPWFSMHQAVPRGPGAWANRGIIIRHWDAKLSGKPSRPFAAERGAKVRGQDTSLIDLLPPSDVKHLLPGDYVDAVIEHVVIPQFARDYYGPNQALKAALEKNENTWKMVHREAVGNDLAISISTGHLQRQRPTIIAAHNNTADFTLTGGLAYVPITISGLTNYREPVLELQAPDGSHPIDQSIHGHDFWQTDLDPATGLWQITYSIPSDSPTDQRLARHYRFSMR